MPNFMRDNHVSCIESASHNQLDSLRTAPFRNYGAHYLLLGRLPARLHETAKAGQGALQDKRKSVGLRCRVDRSRARYTKMRGGWGLTHCNRIRLAHLAAEAGGQQGIPRYQGWWGRQPEQQLSIAHSSHN